MGIFSWVQNKFNGGVQEKKRFEAGESSARHMPVAEARKEEFDDWPQALLSIGTFGNKESKEEQPSQKVESSPQDLDSSEDHIPDFTIEEVNKLQKELTKLLTRKSKSSEVGEEDRINLPLNRFLNCPSSLEVDRTGSKNAEHDNNGDLSPNTKIIISKVRDILLGNRKSVQKKSLSFLFNKVFVCASGFAPAPSLRDPIPESRMEKILRAILTKKSYPQSSAKTTTTTATTKKYLEDKPAEKRRAGKEEDMRKDEGKWVKTDSDFIVLEI